MSSDLAAFQEELTKALNDHGVPAMPSWREAIEWLADRGSGLLAWAELYGEPEEWVKRAQNAHARAERLEAQRDRLRGAIRDYIDARAALMNASEQGREWADEKNAYHAAEHAMFTAYDAAAFDDAGHPDASALSKTRPPDERP